MLILTRKQGESFLLGDDIEITISEISGDKIRIAIDAPREVKVLRKELKDAGELNKEAAALPSSTSIQAISNLENMFKEKNRLKLYEHLRNLYLYLRKNLKIFSLFLWIKY